MSLQLSQPYYTSFHSAQVPFLTAPHMLLTLWHPRCAFIKFLRLHVPTFYGEVRILWLGFLLELKREFSHLPTSLIQIVSIHFLYFTFAFHSLNLCTHKYQELV